MAQKKIYFGSTGPFFFNDEEQYPDDSGTQTGIKTEGFLETDEGLITNNLSTNVRIVFSDAEKKLQEVNSLAAWINGSGGVNVSDDGDGSATVTISQTEALRLPSLTSTMRNNLTPDGPSIIWNVTESRIEYYDGTGWYYLGGTAV